MIIKENININKIKTEIIERLLPLEPDKVILFGSHAYGSPNEDSDIDIFIMKNGLTLEDTRKYVLKARKLIRDLIFKYNIGFDILADNEEHANYRINEIKDQFYDEVFNNGSVIYVKS